MRTAFVGAVEGSALALDALVRADLAPDLVITLPPEAAGRHSDFADLAPLAQAGSSEIVYATDINGPVALDALMAFETELALVIGWSQICYAGFLSIPAIGSIGFHPAPLPRMRGRAVIPWTILLGEPETAATLFWLDEGVDSGPILLQERIEVSPTETARTLYTKQIRALARMLPEALRRIRTGDVPRIEQDHTRATYCARRTAEDGLIDWREPAENVIRLIRAVGDPYPGAFTRYAGEWLTIDAAADFPDARRYIGLAGQVQCHTPEGFVVRCGDGEAVHVTAWRRNGDASRPKLHAKLGGHAP